MLRFLVVVSVSVAACVSSRPNPSPATEEAVNAAWTALSEGDFAAAGVGFKAMEARPGRSGEARAGLLSLAQATSDYEGSRRLLEGLDPETSAPLLAVTAGEVAVSLRPQHAKAMGLVERACALRGETDLGRRAASVCSLKPLLALGRDFERCAAGCSNAVRVPLLFVGSQPVVKASVNGGEEAAFVVDTGASTSLITTQYAAKAGIQALPGTQVEEYASGGARVATSRALVSIRTQGLQIDDVPVVIADLPFEAIAGIIAPQRT